MSALEQARSTLHLAVNHPLRFLYLLLQLILDLIFSPSPPPPGAKGGKIQRQRIAVIGAGLTGVSSAAHYVDHGFDVKIFEARSKEHGLSGIWSRVNSTSTLQIHSIMFRFHPSVKWESAYPNQRQVREKIISLWRR